MKKNDNAYLADIRDRCQLIVAHTADLLMKPPLQNATSPANSFKLARKRAIYLLGIRRCLLS